MISLNPRNWFARRSPTPAERLQAIVDATARSPAIIQYRIYRAAGKLGARRRNERTRA